MTKKTEIKITRNTPVNFGMLSDAMDTLLNGMQRMFDDQNLGLNNNFKNINERFDKVETDIRYVHDSLKKEIDELKYDTPTLKQFNQLKDRVDKIYPTL